MTRAASVAPKELVSASRAAPCSSAAPLRRVAYNGPFSAVGLSCRRAPAAILRLPILTIAGDRKGLNPRAVPANSL